MQLLITAERTIDAPPLAVYALSLDAERFPALFRGFGPIPALRRITPHAPSAVGSTREVESSDGSRLTERITALDPGERHAYTLTGLRPPLAWLARAGHADWRFVPVEGGTYVTWAYRFELTSPLAWPLAWPVLQGGMRVAMQRCLDAMQLVLAPAKAVA
jgi:uncharacterized protein YndB with AHSA1/START domain